MVDINLLGEEDDAQQDNNEENSENFSEETYSNNTEELTSDQDYTDSELDDSIYGSYSNNTSKKSVFIAIGVILIISISVTAYFLLGSRGDDPTTTNEDAVENVAVDQKEPKSESEKETKAQDELITHDIPKPEVAPYIKEVVVSNKNGIRTIETILATIPPSANFTMIRYSDGNFLTEILANSTTHFTTINNELKQKLTNASVKILSQDNKNIQGRNYKQALFNIDVELSNFDYVEEPTYMQRGEIKNTFKQYCNQLGLRLKEFDLKDRVTFAGYNKTPVIFKASGKKDAIINFLNQLIEQNLNINLSKIVFITPTRNLNSKTVDLVLNLEIFQPI